MLNPGYKIIAKSKKIECKSLRAFICPRCKKVFLEVDQETDHFLTKCAHCRSWIYGEKIVEQNAIKK